MKRCPVCQSEYFDDSLNFCLTDGATLNFVSNADETVQMSADQNPVRIDVPQQDSVPTVFPPAAAPPTARRGINPLVIITLFGLLFLSVLGVLGYIFLKPSNNPAANAAVPPLTNAQTPNNDTAVLKEEIAKLKEQVENKKQPPTPIPSPPYPTQKETSVTSVDASARVDSPNDGFLALRGDPDPDAGERLAKIPHGASVKVTNCQTVIKRVGGRTGRWCQIQYRGMRGWVFDGWLVY